MKVDIASGGAEGRHEGAGSVEMTTVTLKVENAYSDGYSSDCYTITVLEAPGRSELVGLSNEWVGA